MPQSETERKERYLFLKKEKLIVLTNQGVRKKSRTTTKGLKYIEGRGRVRELFQFGKGGGVIRGSLEKRVECFSIIRVHLSE